MTFIEKMKIDHPEKVNDVYKGGCEGCPENYGYEECRNNCGGPDDEVCRDCWNRTIPRTENKEPVEKEELPIFVSNQMRRDMLDTRSSFIAKFYGDLVGAIGDRAKAYELTKMAFEKGWFG